MIIKLLPLVPHDTKINFFGHRFYALFISLVIVLGSTVVLATKGLNFGIDFTGGTIIEVTAPADPSLPDLREKLAALDMGEISIQEFGDNRTLMIRLPQQEGGEEVQKGAIERVRETLNAEYAAAGEVDYRRIEYVGPQVGEELKLKGLIAIIVAIGGIMSYIMLRFNWQYGIGAMFALIHDILGILGLFSLTQMPFDLSTLAAVLLVAGYSMNETVIIFDRVRETLRKFRKLPMDEVINYSINSTLSRTIMTSGSTILTIFALWLFGGLVIQSFVSALFIGILIGTHSSYFVSSLSLYYLKLRPPVEGEAKKAD